MGNLSIGKIAFIVGLLVAVVSAFISVPQAELILLVLGLVIGFLNISDSESTGFLVAGIALLLSVSSASGLPEIGDIVTRVMVHITALVAPAMLVVAVKSLLSAAAD